MPVHRPFLPTSTQDCEIRPQCPFHMYQEPWLDTPQASRYHFMDTYRTQSMHGYVPGTLAGHTSGLKVPFHMYQEPWLDTPQASRYHFICTRNLGWTHLRPQGTISYVPGALAGHTSGLKVPFHMYQEPWLDTLQASRYHFMCTRSLGWSHKLHTVTMGFLRNYIQEI